MRFSELIRADFLHDFRSPDLKSSRSRAGFNADCMFTAKAIRPDRPGEGPPLCGYARVAENVERIGPFYWLVGVCRRSMRRAIRDNKRAGIQIGPGLDRVSCDHTQLFTFEFPRAAPRSYSVRLRIHEGSRLVSATERIGPARPAMSQRSKRRMMVCRLPPCKHWQNQAPLRL